MSDSQLGQSVFEPMQARPAGALGAMARFPRSVAYWLRTGGLLALFFALLLQLPANATQFLSLVALLAYLRAGQMHRAAGSGHQHINWIRLDLIIYAGVIAAAGGSSSPLLPLMLVPVGMLAATEGVRTALVALLAVAAVLLFAATEVSAGNTLLQWPPAIVLIPSIVLGLLLWVRTEIAAQRQADELNALGIALRDCADEGGFASLIAGRLRKACPAEACLVTVMDGQTGRWKMAYALPDCSEPLQAECTLAEMPAPVRHLHSLHTLFTSASRSRWGPPVHTLVEPFSLPDTAHDGAIMAELHHHFGHRSLASFPLLARGLALGRVVLVSRQEIAPSALRAMYQIGASAALMIENSWLQQKEGPVTERTRRRISRDLHDGIIQPMIGLKMGLEALRTKAGTALLMDLNELIGMTDKGVQELRRYTGSLADARREQADKGKRNLLELLREQADSFSRHNGIPTQVLAESIEEVGGRMRDEVMYIVREGLSNIRRHSQSDSATVRLKAGKGRLLIELLNDDRTSRFSEAPFFPKSIGERAADLGGSITVQRSPEGRTSVEVDLPLEVR